MKILITGGAGFIGQATAKALIESGHQVWLFDNMSPQIHGSKLQNGESLWGELVVGDITNQSEVVRCLSEGFTRFTILLPKQEPSIYTNGGLFSRELSRYDRGVAGNQHPGRVG